MEEKKTRTLLSKILLFAGILGFPAFFILFFAMGKQQFEKLKYYGEHTIISKTVDGKSVNDTIYYKVPGFQFKDAHGNLITEKDAKGKITIVNFVYKNCPSDFCPLDFQGFEMYVSEEINLNDGFKDVMIISCFVPTSADTTKEMLEFIKFHNINEKNWKIVTGDMGQIYDIDMKTQNPWQVKDSLFGMEKLAYNMTLLLDRELHIRGKYITSQRSETKRITKEVSILLRTEKEIKNEKSK